MGEVLSLAVTPTLRSLKRPDNVGHPFLFLFPHVSFHSHSFFFFNARSQRGFSSPKGGLQLQLPYFSFTVLNFYVLRLHSQPPALLQSLCLSFFLLPLPQCKARAKQKNLLATPQSVCGTPVCQGFNDSFVYLYAGGAGSSDTARANEALCQMDRETYLQVSSWVLEAQLDWP